MTSDKATGEPTLRTDIGTRIYTERVRLLYASTPAAAIAIVVAVGFLTYLFKDSLTTLCSYYNGWVAYMLLVAVLRTIIYISFIKRVATHNNPLWGRLAIFMSAITGLGWGGCIVVFSPFLEVVEQLTLTLVIVAYLAGALTTQFPISSALSSLLFPVVIPLVIMDFRIEGKLGYSLGIMLIVFILYVVSASVRLRRLLISSLQLRFGNEALALRLRREKAKTQDLNDSLTAEIEKRKKDALELIVAHREAKQANRAKTEFLANMSHDIRTPMNVIIGMSGIVLETKLDPEQQKYIESIRDSSESLLSLLNDILDISKIEAGQLLIDKHDFSLKNMLDSIYTTMDFEAKKKGLDLVFQQVPPGLPALVHGDELRLRQILLNLIYNGIKFTAKGSVTLTVLSEAQGDNRIQLHCMVSDTGIGIHAENQESIFSNFNQADSSTTRNFGGTGLGLTISKKLVEMMEGSIWLTSDSLQGSTFHFTVMLDLCNSENIPLTNEAVAPSVKLRILFVDDDETNCEIGRHILENDGHQVVTVHSGMEFLECMALKNYDLVFMDVKMPEMDGLTACAILRASENNCDLPLWPLPPFLPDLLVKQCKGKHTIIAAMTAHAMVGDKEKCLDAGMDTYLTKPFDKVQIRRMITDYFN